MRTWSAARGILFAPGLTHPSWTVCVSTCVLAVISTPFPSQHTRAGCDDLKAFSSGNTRGYGCAGRRANRTRRTDVRSVAQAGGPRTKRTQLRILYAYAEEHTLHGQSRVHVHIYIYTQVRPPQRSVGSWHVSKHPWSASDDASGSLRECAWCRGLVFAPRSSVSTAGAISTARRVSL